MQLIQWNSFHVEYTLYLLERTHKTELGKKRMIKIKNWPICSIFRANFRLRKMPLRSSHLILALLRRLLYFYHKLLHGIIFCMFWHNITSLQTSYRISVVDMNFGPLSAPSQTKVASLRILTIFNESPIKLGCWRSYGDDEAYIISSFCLQVPLECLK